MYEELLGKAVFNALGAPLGTVVAVACDPKGRVRLSVREPGPLGPVRLVDTSHVAEVDGCGIRLKGPRQGYHIVPLARVGEVPGVPPSPFPDR